MSNYIYDELIFRPQFNLFTLFFELTKSPILSLVLLALAFNVVAFRWYLKSYLNGQKRLALTQDMKNMNSYLQERQADIKKQINDITSKPNYDHTTVSALQVKMAGMARDSQKERNELNKKFKIAGNYSLKVGLLQLWISFGLFDILNRVSKGGSIQGLYGWLFGGQSGYDFGANIKLFGSIDMAQSVWQSGLWWVAVINSLFTGVALYYMTKMSLKPTLRELTPFEVKYTEDKKKEREILSDGVEQPDPEKIAKQVQDVNLLIMPLISLFFNLSGAVNTGINVYYLFLSLLFMIKVMLADYFYRTHNQQYILDIANTGPHYAFESQMADISGYGNKGSKSIFADNLLPATPDKTEVVVGKGKKK